MLVHIPDFSTDAEAEAFLDQDLSGLDPSQFKLLKLEFSPSPSFERVVPFAVEDDKN